MNQSVFDIERVVTEVLAELRRLAGGAVGCPSHGSAAHDRPRPETPAPAASPSHGQAGDGDLRSGPEGSSSDAGQLVFQGRVLTLEALFGRLGSLRRVLIQPRTIVTPAVRDELQRRGIALEYSSAAQRQTEGAIRLAVVNALRGFQAGELTAALESEGVQVDAVNLDCLIAAADRLAAQLRQPGTLGLLLTGHVSAALCLANRHGGVRAVAAGDLPSMAAAVESVGANLLILDAAALTTFQLRQMAVQFCRGGVRQCPEKLRSRLA